MNDSYRLVENLSALFEIQPDSIVSRTFFKGERLKSILFGFDAGQELTEHTSSQAAMIQIVQGQATVTVGDDKHELGVGCWLHMQPCVKHSVHANSPLMLLLTMYSSEKE
jgi:quercetin dioxygenase-like cupin family protein